MNKIIYSPISTLLKIALVLAAIAYVGLLYYVFFVWQTRSTAHFIGAALFSLLVVFAGFAATTKFTITTEGLQEKAVLLKDNAMPWKEIGAFYVYSKKDFKLAGSFMLAMLFKILPFRRPVNILYFVKFVDGKGLEIEIKLDKRSAPFLRQVVSRLHKHEKYFEDPGDFEGKKYDAKAEWARLIPVNPPV